MNLATPNPPADETLALYGSRLWHVRCLIVLLVAFSAACSISAIQLTNQHLPGRTGEDPDYRVRVSLVHHQLSVTGVTRCQIAGDIEPGGVVTVWTAPTRTMAVGRLA